MTTLLINNYYDVVHNYYRAMLQHSKASERANVRIETINFLNDYE